MSKLLLSLELNSIANGYRALEEVSQFSSHIIEAAALHKGSFWLFAEVEKKTEAFAQWQKKIIKNPFYKDMTILENAHPQLREALYGLLATKIQRYLAIIEADSVSTNIRLVEKLHSCNPIELIEIQSGRGLGGQSLLYFTGQENAEIQIFLQAQKSQFPLMSHFEIIENPSETFSQYFNL